MFYLGNYASLMDFECLRDDGGYDAIEDLATPAGFVLLDRDPPTIQALLDTAWEDAVEFMVEDGETPPDPDWETTGWNETNEGHGSQTWTSSAIDTVVIVRTAKPLVASGGPA